MCNTKNVNNKIIGIRAGYNIKLSDRLPFISAKNERCIPQPGQSKPKYFL